MTILWITEQYYPNTGGMAQSCDRIVHGLRQQGVCIDVVHLTRKPRRKKSGNAKQGYDMCWHLGDNPAHQLHMLWIWLEQRQEEQQEPKLYQKIVGYGMHYAPMAARNFSAWLALPLLSFVRGNDFDIGIFDLRRRSLLEDVYQHADTVFCVSQDKAQKISALFPQANTLSIGNGISLESWQALPSHQRQAEAIKQKTSPDKKIIGLFGDIKDKKGGRFFIDALQHCQYHDDFHLLIIGAVEPELLTWLDHPELTIDITLLPSQDRYQLIPYYLACHAIAIPSFYDGAPNVMLEAAALGRPMIAANTGGMKDMLSHQENALLFKPANPHSLRECLDLLASMHDAPMSELGNNAKALVEQYYSAEHETAAYLPYFKNPKQGADVNE